MCLILSGLYITIRAPFFHIGVSGQDKFNQGNNPASMYALTAVPIVVILALGVMIWMKVSWIQGICTRNAAIDVDDQIQTHTSEL